VLAPSAALQATPPVAEVLADTHHGLRAPGSLCLRETTGFRVRFLPPWPRNAGSLGPYACCKEPSGLLNERGSSTPRWHSPSVTSRNVLELAEWVAQSRRRAHTRVPAFPLSPDSLLQVEGWVAKREEAPVVVCNPMCRPASPCTSAARTPPDGGHGCRETCSCPL